MDFFCQSEPELRDAGLDETHPSRIVRRPSHIDGYDYRTSDWETARTNGKDVWLLDPDELSGVPDTIAAFSRRSTTDDARSVEDATDERGDSNLIEYLRTGITEHDLTDTTTFEARPHWYRPPRKDPTRVLVQSAGRDGFRFVLNEAGVRNTNACYGLYDIGLTDRRLKALLAYLNSGVFADVFREHYRTLDGGFKKAEPGDFESAPVIDPTELDADRVAGLADAFDALRETARAGGDTDSVLDRIDAELRRAL
ncbi:hypothetical protein U4E84_04175 [Halorubrum sp. AD140]|uniref:hypothetical protein n=1 Tax=Halorubrum sp. AD140 TaxID=3050073 RepID=UPI002ACCF1A5|nr:hypothetical protein [Halorubrum sp. AD140]MDZ5810546.1 hypothetical protein [Halorubrum sp. AD140]